MTFAQLWNATHADTEPDPAGVALLRALFEEPAPAPTPAELRRDREDFMRRNATMARIARGELPPAAGPQASIASVREREANYMRQRRQAARAAGYRGPLTRAELAARAARAAR